jgi:GYF domain 2
MPRAASAAEDEMQWYYTVQGQRQGPVDDIGVEDLVRQGVIRDDTYVWHEGMAEWQLYASVKPKPAPEPVRTPNPAPAAPPRPAENPASRESAGGSGLGSPATVQSAPARPRPAPTPVRLQAAPKSYFFYYPVLRGLERGGVIRTCVVWGLKIGAIAMILGGLLSAAGIVSSAQGLGGGGMLGAIFLAVILLATSLCVAQVCWYRAGSVEALGDADYTLIPITSILCRAGAECGATGFTGLAVGACLFLWFSPAGAGGFGALPIPVSLPVTTGFLGGILALLYFGLLALGSLIGGYFAAEWIGVLVDIAESIHKIRRAVEKTE